MSNSRNIFTPYYANFNKITRCLQKSRLVHSLYFNICHGRANKKYNYRKQEIGIKDHLTNNNNIYYKLIEKRFAIYQINILGFLKSA